MSDSLKLPSNSWRAWFDVPGEGIKQLETNVYDLNDLFAGDIIEGPALILQNTCIIVIEPKSAAEFTSEPLAIFRHKGSLVPYRKHQYQQRSNKDGI